MKAGDLVKKAGGVTDIGHVGIVIKIHHGDNRGYPAAEILFSTGKHILWAIHLLEVISEAR